MRNEPVFVGLDVAKADQRCVEFRVEVGPSGSGILVFNVPAGGARRIKMIQSDS